MCLRRIHLRLWHPSLTLLNSKPCLSPILKTASFTSHPCQTLIKARPVRSLSNQRLSKPIHRCLSSLKGTKTALAANDSPHDSDTKDTPVIHLADAKLVLDLDQPDDVKRWQVIQEGHSSVSQLELRGEAESKSDGSASDSSVGVSVRRLAIASEWRPIAGTGPMPKQLAQLYLQLSKFRLTMLVAATSAGGYGMVNAEVFEPGLLVASTFGVMLVSASANAINQYLEVPFDSQMARTRNRPLVRGLISPTHALGFALGAGVTGTAILATQVNPTAAALGLANLALYTGVYTPMKRVTVYNTWVGSVVGAIPPLIGWASASGGSLDPGALVMAGVLFTWQFPHFNALSWNLRPDYSRAGYRMMSVTDPGLCRRTTLRHSVLCTLVCSVAAPTLGLTTASFALESLPLNAGLTYLSWKFYKNPDAASSRKLFRFTLIHLPLLMILLFIAKQRQSSALENLKTTSDRPSVTF